MVGIAEENRYLNPEFKIIFRDGSIDEIKKFKGIKYDNELARELGITKGYMSQLRSFAPVSPIVMTRVAFMTGSIRKGWHMFYDIVPSKGFGPNHPSWNLTKHDGIVPYQRYSPSAELRRNDYPAETQ